MTAVLIQTSWVVDRDRDTTTLRAIAIIAELRKGLRRDGAGQSGSDDVKVGEEHGDDEMLDKRAGWLEVLVIGEVTVTFIAHEHPYFVNTGPQNRDS